MAAYMTGKDMLLLPDGSTYHLAVKHGDIFPRIVTVGTPTRAEVISRHFDTDKEVKVMTAARGFNIYSGYFNGVGISVVSIGMGSPMMDFLIREISYICPGPIAVIRFGTCGIFNKDIRPGSVLCCGDGSMYVYTNYICEDGAFLASQQGINTEPYHVTKPVPCHKPLSDLLVKEVRATQLPCYDGKNASGETFYSCQGRVDERFKDRNEHLMKVLSDAKIDSMDMETHQLFHLAKLRRDPCYAACMLAGIVNRVNDSFTENITASDMQKIEYEGGRCCLAALAKFSLQA